MVSCVSLAIIYHIIIIIFRLIFVIMIIKNMDVFIIIWSEGQSLRCHMFPLPLFIILLLL